MRLHSQSILVHSLAALAIASIAMGPSPFAADAEMTARVKRDRASRQADPACSEDQVPAEPDPAGKPVRASDGIASFVAPASAKPAEMQGDAPTFAVHSLCWKQPPTVDVSIVVVSPPVVSQRLLDYPPHQPNAPPIV